MKRLLLSILFALCLAAPAVAQTTSYTFLSAQTTTTAACSSSRAVNAKAWSPLRTFIATGTTSAGAGAATVTIYGSNNGTTTWVSLGTMTLTLATTITADTNTAGFVSNAPWPYLCAVLSAISGTNAAVTVLGAMQ